MPESDPNKLDPNDILVAEFEYIAQTAFQANEDRARVTSFYQAAVGSFIAAILSTQFITNSENLKTIQLFFSALFILLTALGLLTILQLARLRSAWFRSADAMNEIKKYYIKYLPDANLGEAITWLKLPKKFANKSVASLMVIQIAVISALTFGAASYFLMLFFEIAKCQWVVAIFSSIFAYFIQVNLYKKYLE